MKPDQMQAGKLYRLMPKNSAYAKSIIRKVESIERDKVAVLVNGRTKVFSLKIFANLAVEEIGQQSIVGS
ncbi:hypothetical protein [Paenibacillus sp. GXUN7292]|uniref:hypothetical protein n=1 Tax=Paenibacillus sp. GXUN7292 TaxID=3422499 RepID=UPI003D7DE5D0